jgi:hypothetical protein
MNKSHPKSSKAENLGSSTTLNLLDEALDCCQNIDTLAALLRNMNLQPQGDCVEPLLFSNAGYLIGRELEQLRKIHQRLRSQLSALGPQRPENRG